MSNPFEVNQTKVLEKLKTLTTKEKYEVAAACDISYSTIRLYIKGQFKTQRVSTMAALYNHLFGGEA